MTLAVLVVRDGAVLRRDPRRHARARAGGRDPAAAGAMARACRSRSRFVLLALAARVYLGRFERLFDDHTIFAGVTYTEAHVTLTGMLVVAVALVARRRDRRSSTRVAAPRLRWLGRGGRCRPRSATWSPASLGWYVNSFIVKPNELVREQPVHHAQHRDDAAGVRARSASSSGRSRPRPASRRSTLANNQATLQNIRLWDWRALQDTLRQIQEIRTYYDFPDIDIDRYDDRRHAAADDARRARAERRAAAREQPQLDQREADLHARLRRHDESGQRLHARRAARR